MSGSPPPPPPPAPPSPPPYPSPGAPPGPYGSPPQTPPPQGQGFYPPQGYAPQGQPYPQQPLYATGPICPRCRSGMTKKGEIPVWAIVLAVVLCPIGLLFLLVKDPAQCYSCGFSWKT